MNYMIDNQEIWWKNCFGPQKTIGTIFNHLMDGHIAIVYYHDELPYIEKLKYLVEKSLYTQGVFTPRIYDLSSDGIIPSKLFEKFLNSQTIESLKKTDVQRIAEKLRYERILPILYNISDSNRSQWMKFINDYSEIESTSPVLMFINSETNFSKDFSSKIKFIDIASMINKIDTKLFLYNIIDDDNYKDYFVELLSSICDNYSDLASNLYAEMKKQDYDLLKSVEILYKNQYQDHSLMEMLNRNNAIELKKRIRNAQIQFGFPKLEEERIVLLDRYEKEFRLKMNNLKEEFHAEDVFDLELSDILRINNHKIKDKREKVILKDSEKRRIIFLKDIRNKLAHLEILAYDEIKDLLNERLSIK